MNYGHIADALSFYRERGYFYADDAPWYVSQEAYYATRPEGATDVRIATTDVTDHGSNFVGRGYLVASGEQSFIQMMLDGQEIKRAVCVTPCFRWEPRVDMLHRKHFLKAELINAHDVDEGHLIHMVHDACSFFERFFSVRVVETEIGYDIVEKSTRFELGSYGIRRVDIPLTSAHAQIRCTRTFSWIFGTGCAEPRLSLAIERFNRNAGR